ncbi:hypothetical protein [Solobacterium moorei]|uniref:hypothetical protein n=1 Tax=Solobacterium moorei TaxID=102148 RepID=UPI00040A26FE|nr:hypothetical protein [Solobacterium moorei]BET21968.1 hypothetical protein RGT18_15560 [Solobacterium moorei]
MTFAVDDSSEFAKEAHVTLLEEKLFFSEIREILGKRANFISRLSMKNADRGKKTIILRLRLSNL